MDEHRLFKMNNGEMVIGKVVETTSDGLYIIDFPAGVVPIPPEHAGGARNQIGFGKFMPFSDYNREVMLNPDQIAVHSSADANIINAYEQWVTHMKAQQSGIVLAGSNDMPKAAGDFNNLNV